MQTPHREAFWLNPSMLTTTEMFYTFQMPLELCDCFNDVFFLRQPTQVLASSLQTAFSLRNSKDWVNLDIIKWWRKTLATTTTDYHSITQPLTLRAKTYNRQSHCASTFSWKTCGVVGVEGHANKPLIRMGTKRANMRQVHPLPRPLHRFLLIHPPKSQQRVISFFNLQRLSVAGCQS